MYNTTWVVNHTGRSDFVLVGLFSQSKHPTLLCVVIFVVFLMALSGNTILILLIHCDAHLHNPMYFFITQLSLMDVMYISVTVPKMLMDQVMGVKQISAPECGMQMFLYLTLGGSEFFLLAAMAYDRYVAICHPLQYPTIITNRFVVKASAFIVAQNALLLSPVPILSAQLHYCGKNVIENCICANLSVSRLSCDNFTLNRIYQFVAGWTLLGSDFILIFLSYTFILRAVLRFKTEGAAVKALSTCGSHFILILFFSTILWLLC